MPVESPTDPREAVLRQLRLLINDPAPDGDDTGCVFSDADLVDFLTLEGDVLKRAAAQALDTIADDETLTSKVIRTAAGTTTDGAKVADSLRKRATALRAQADADDDAADGGFFEVVDVIGVCSGGPELTEFPRSW